MKKVMITGASGLIGMPIVREFASFDAYDIYAITSGRREIAFPANVKIKTANLLDKNETGKLIKEIKPEIMIHLAWDISRPDYLTSASNFEWLEESLFMLHTFMESGGKYFVFAGSSAEYGSFRGFSEKESVGDITLYGRCKNSFHNVAEKICEINNIDYVNLRIFSTMGKGMRLVTATNAAVATFAKGEKFTCKAPYNIWDFVSVDDVAKAVFATVKKQYKGVVNIGRGIPCMVGDVLKKIAKKMNADHLLSIDYDNRDYIILVADTHILNNIIGYTCSDDIDEMLDDMIVSMSEGNA